MSDAKSHKEQLIELQLQNEDLRDALRWALCRIPRRLADPNFSYVFSLAGMDPDTLELTDA